MFDRIDLNLQEQETYFFLYWAQDLDYKKEPMPYLMRAY